MSKKMKVEETSSGNRIVAHPSFQPEIRARLLQDADGRLWVGNKHCLTRPEVKELIEIMNRWVRTNRLCNRRFRLLDSSVLGGAD